MKTILALFESNNPLNIQLGIMLLGKSFYEMNRWLMENNALFRICYWISVDRTQIRKLEKYYSNYNRIILDPEFTMKLGDYRKELRDLGIFNIIEGKR